MTTKYSNVYDVVFVTDSGAHIIIFSSLIEASAEAMRQWYCKKHGYDVENPMISYISPKKVFNSDTFEEKDYKEFIKGE